VAASAPAPPPETDDPTNPERHVMEWRSWIGALALIGALAACGGEEGKTIVTPLECESGMLHCGTSCVDTSSDPRHCGGCDNVCAAGEICLDGTCGIACPQGQELCDGACVDLATDRANCGACGQACGTAEVCVDGSCAIACPEGQEVCGGTCVTLATSNEHCGACDVACGAGEACVDGSCGTVCPDGQTICDGACVSLATSNQHCGGCNVACDAGEVCSDGACAASCPAGQTACDGGCFDLDTARTHCGACGVVCAAGEICSDGACAASCGAGLTECDGLCLDLATNRAHCGTCGNACGPDELCVAGSCTLHCAAGTSECDGACVDTATHAGHCGGCGVACAPGERCEAGRCEPACDASALTVCDGICTNTDTDPLNCGSCGSPCGPGFVCDGGTCAAFCAPPKTDCAGACTSTDSDPAHCGACGNACTPPANAVAVCAEGACSGVCQTGFADCNGDLGADGSDGCETPVATTAAHCGGCGNRCPAPPNATAACVDSTCGLGACLSGFDDCDGLAENGCEVELATDGQHCGVCGNTCAPGTGCSNGTCVPLPPGDDCAFPIELTPGTHAVEWHASALDYLTAAPTCGAGAAPVGPDVVLRFDSTITGEATFTLQKPANHRWHVVVGGSTCGTLTPQHACASESTGTSLTTRFPVSPGESYYLYVVDTATGAGPLDNPLHYTFELLDCATYSPGVRTFPANGETIHVAGYPIVIEFADPIDPTVGTLTATGSLGTVYVADVGSTSVRKVNGNRTLTWEPGPFPAGETFTVTWSGITSTVCAAPIPVPAWTFTSAAPATCVPGSGGMVGGSFTRVQTGILGTVTEYYLAADDDPAGWVYVGGTSTLNRVSKVNGVAQLISGMAGLTSSHLGYDMVVDGPNIYTVDDGTSGPRLYRISSDGGATWEVEEAATFPVTPADDFRSAVASGGRIYLLTQETTEQNEIWSVDTTGPLPAEGVLELAFGSGVFEYCQGLAMDSTYFFTNCRSDRSTSLFYQVRVDRTTGAWTILSAGFDHNTTAMSMSAADVDADGAADYLYFASDNEEGYAICNPRGTPGSMELYEFGTATTNYGSVWDRSLNVIWAFDDDTNELIRVQ